MSVEPNFVKIGQNIKIMRIRKGVTQSELAKKLGISQTHMSNLEHGRVSVNLKVLLRLSHYFSCGVDALLGLTLNTEVKEAGPCDHRGQESGGAAGHGSGD